MAQIILQIAYPGYPIGTILTQIADGNYYSPDSSLWISPDIIAAQPDNFLPVMEG